MRKLDLWFPKPLKPGNENTAESAFGCKTAYIAVVNPFDDGSGCHTMVKSEGRILPFPEATSAAECIAQIDRLIRDLQRLKPKVVREFKKGEPN